MVLALPVLAVLAVASAASGATTASRAAHITGPLRTLTLVGSMIDTGGQPVSGAEVLAVPADGASGAPPTSAAGSDRDSTGSDGTFNLHGLTPGVPYLIKVSASDGNYFDFSEGPQSWSEGGTYSVGALQLPPSTSDDNDWTCADPTYNGTVSGPGGSPVTGAAVQLVAQDGATVATAAADGDGNYCFTTPGGPYAVYSPGWDAVLGDGQYVPVYAGGSTTLAGAILETGGSTPIDLSLNPVSLIGSIGDANTGQPLVGVPVELLGADGQAAVGTSTGAGGDFSFSGAGGPYTLYVPRYCSSATRCYAPQYNSATTVASDATSFSLDPNSTRTISLSIGLVAEPTHPPAWLRIINYWRAANGLEPVDDDPSADEGIVQHLTYLVRSPAKYLTGEYANAHLENPKSPFYTGAGETAGASSDLAYGTPTTVSALDEWLAAPFHALAIFSGYETEMALAVHDGDAGLESVSPQDGWPITESLEAKGRPILFPGPGTTTPLLRFTGESPSPLQTCGWTSAGLPIILSLPHAVSRKLTAALSGPGQTETTGNHALCVVDRYTYRTTDRVYGPTGKEILQPGYDVFLIPRHDLRAGTYSVTVKQPGQSPIAWSFHAKRP